MTCLPRNVFQRKWQQKYLDLFYPVASWRRNGTRDFHDLCRKYCGGRILELGPGLSNPTSGFLSGLGELYGADIDPEVIRNTALRAAFMIGTNGKLFPLSDAAFDSCVSNYVCEHVEAPQTHLREVSRVLKPGGCYVFRTPNKFHYTSLVSCLTPHWFHLKAANRLRRISGHDPYPTFYRLNTARRIRRLARASGFEVKQIEFVEREPSYGMSSRVLFLLFTVYERLVNSTRLLAMFRSNLFVVLQKPLN